MLKQSLARTFSGNFLLLRGGYFAQHHMRNILSFTRLETEFLESVLSTVLELSCITKWNIKWNYTGHQVHFRIESVSDPFTTIHHENRNQIFANIAKVYINPQYYNFGYQHTSVIKIFGIILQISIAIAVKKNELLQHVFSA